MKYFVFVILISIELSLFQRANAEECLDTDPNCGGWANFGYCQNSQDKYIAEHCNASCGRCRGVVKDVPLDPVMERSLKKYDIRALAPDLAPLGFMLGRWYSKFDGKVVFPTIPVFTYGEMLDISVGDMSPLSPPTLNYTAFAFGVNEGDDLHTEHGYFTAWGASQISLSTVMNNGFTTVEEGFVDNGGRRLVMTLKQIGRVSFGRDLTVTNSRRMFQLISDRVMEQRFEMETVTHKLQKHTSVTYRKVFP